MKDDDKSSKVDERQLYDKPAKKTSKVSYSVVSLLCVIHVVMSFLSLYKLRLTLIIIFKPTGGETAEESVNSNAKTIVSVIMMLLLLMFVVHCTYVTSNAYSHPSVVLQSSTSNG